MGSFEQAEEALARLGHVKMSDNTIWQRAKKWGQRFQALEKQQQGAANHLARQDEIGPAKKGVVVFQTGKSPLWKSFTSKPF